jgi:hypothetical protein
MTKMPRVTRETRERIAEEIEDTGPKAFTLAVIKELEKDNPELLEMTYTFAKNRDDFLETILGFAVFYRLLKAQSAAEATRLH